VADGSAHTSQLVLESAVTPQSLAAASTTGAAGGQNQLLSDKLGTKTSRVQPPRRRPNIMLMQHIR